MAETKIAKYEAFAQSPEHLMPRNKYLFSSIEVHRMMIFDPIRTEKFREAIFKCVKDGDVVVDLGTGSGILAVFCAQAGASKVFAIEETSIAEVAKGVISANGCTDKVLVLQENSQRLQLPYKADVIVSEIVGHFILEEGILDYFPDATERFLAPSGRIIPQSAKSFVVPIESEELYDLTVGLWRRPHYGVDLSSIANESANNVFVVELDPGSFLSEKGVLFELQLSKPGQKSGQAEIRFLSSRTGTCHGFGGWFELLLTPGCILSTAPDAPLTHWQQCFFPVMSPILINEGDEIRFIFEWSSIGSDIIWTWTVSTSDTSSSFNRVQTQCTLLSRPLDDRSLKHVVLDRTKLKHLQKGGRNSSQ